MTIAELLNDPDKILLKKPYYRGVTSMEKRKGAVKIGERVRASLPAARMNTVTQAQFLEEYDPNSHKILFDDSIPKIIVKNKKGGWSEIDYAAMSVPFQQNIVAKQTLHLCSNNMRHTMINISPTDWQRNFFIRFKQMWQERNFDGAKYQAVEAQKSTGDVGLLFYFDSKGRTRTRVLSYSDGYVIITHKDQNGEHVGEAVYYVDGETGRETIDLYDDTYRYRIVDQTTADAAGRIFSGWVIESAVAHGFPECPLITKRGDVAWNNVQNLIEVYEVIYNIFLVVQKRHGWGNLYIKGKLKELAEKINGSVVLWDNSGDEHADAKFLTPPDPQGIINSLELLEKTIEKGSGTTFILPEDVKVSGDASGIAIQLTQEQDIITARRGVADWQNVANKMSRLAKFGFAKELTASGEKEFKTAISDSEKVFIHSEFVIWRPQSETEYNQMLTTLKGAGGISVQTLVEKNTESTPDEMSRIEKEKQQAMEEALQLASQNNATEEVVISEKE